MVSIYFHLLSSGGGSFRSPVPAVHLEKSAKVDQIELENSSECLRWRVAPVVGGDKIDFRLPSPGGRVKIKSPPHRECSPEGGILSKAGDTT